MAPASAGASIPGSLDFMKTANYTPSYVESTSEVSSKRSSITMSEFSVKAKELAERLEETEKQHVAIKEEEEQEPEAHGTVMYFPGERQPRSRSSSVESWEEWRTMLPLGDLDELTELFRNAPLGSEEGARDLKAGTLVAEVSRVLGVAPALTRAELEARGLLAAHADLEDDEVVAVPSFRTLLDVSLSALKRADREPGQLEWSRKDMSHMEAVLRRCGGREHSISPAHLFEVIGRFHFDGIDVQEPEQQRLIAATTERLLRSRAGETEEPEEGGGLRFGRSYSLNSARRSLASCTAISFQDVLQITGTVLRSLQRQRRAKEFQAERRARREAGFTPAEMEDLRELFNTYRTIDLHVLGHPVRTKLRLPAHKSALARLEALLVVCGIEGFSDWEVQILEDTVEKHMPESEGSTLTFGVFMLCMQNIFAHGIGNIQWQSHQDKSDSIELDSEHCQKLEGRSGFGSFMLLERVRCQQRRREEARVAALHEIRMQQSMGTSSQPFSSRNSWAAVPQSINHSRKSSIGAEDSGRPVPHPPDGVSRQSSTGTFKDSDHHAETAFSGVPSRPPSGSASRVASRPSSVQRGATVHFGTSHAGGNPHPPGHGRSGPRSRQRRTLCGPLVLAKQVPEGEASASSQAANPSSAAAADAAQPRAEESGGSVLKLKGLPAVEVMLGRKEFRACSVDLGQDDLPVPKDSVAGPAMPPRRPLAQPPGPNPPNQSFRREKRGQDALRVVNDAIAKLAERQADGEDNSDHDSRPGALPS